MMSFKESLRWAKQRFLPPSSRSFHESSDALFERLNILEGRLSAIEQRDSRIEECAARIEGRCASVESKLDVFRVHSRLRFESLFCGDSESVDDGRRRFFASIPPASGDMRLMQLACAKLMNELDKRCRALGIDYWFAYGTLIAALSRQGFIPWDDDIDICMMREDIERLRSSLLDDSLYQVTLVYDWYPPCRQIRFCFKDQRIPCFIDLSVYDWARDASKAHDDAFRKLRLDLMSEIHGSNDFPYWKSRGYLVAERSGHVVQVGPVDFSEQDVDKARSETPRIEGVFASYNERAYEQGILCGKEEATAVAYAIDNTYDAPWRRTLWPNDMIFPTHECPFESYAFLVPNKAFDVADECYPGWPYLPEDILGHEHFSREILSDDAVRRAIEEVLAS